jgi:hypothetical protein
MAGHRIVAGRRASTRRSEVAVSGQYKELVVRGRADGFDTEACLLEEVKTYRGRFDRIPANHQALHWAQAKVYGALLCAQLRVPKLKISLVYFEIKSQEETILDEDCTAGELTAFFEQLCEFFLGWAMNEMRTGLGETMAWGLSGFHTRAFDLVSASWPRTPSGRHGFVAVWSHRRPQASARPWRRSFRC